MKDCFGRDVYYLRLSVTDRCNLRCAYCMPESGVKKLRHGDILSVDEIAEIVRAAAACGIYKVRITGGEPLVRCGIVEICRRITAVAGICEVCLTTNGILVPQFVDGLKAAGVDRLNFSLDSLNAVTYNDITRFDALDDALAGVYAALDAGFDAIKINSVLIGGVNDSDDEVFGLLELTRRYNVDVRFIELMPIGECAHWARSRFVSSQRVLEVAPELCKLSLNGEACSDGVSKLYRLPGGLGTVGLISPVSSHFCPSCNRIRVTSTGMLKPCLHSPDEVSLRGLHGDELEGVMRRAIFGKPERHRLEDGAFSDGLRNMNEVGG